MVFLVVSVLTFARYTQCELMSVHYKQPILLIEFEEHKSFSLEARSRVDAPIIRVAEDVSRSSPN